MNNIVSFNQIIDLNKLLQEKDLKFKVHISDACGAQSFYLEPLDESATEDIYEKLQETIEQYFKSSNMQVTYTCDKFNFVIR